MLISSIFSGIDDFSMKSMFGGNVSGSSLKQSVSSLSKHISDVTDDAVNDVFTVSVENDMFYDAILACLEGFKRNQNATYFDFKEVFRSHSKFEFGLYSSLSVEQWGEIKVWVSSIAASHTKYSKAIYNVYRKECAARVEDEYVELVSTVLTLQTLLFSMDKAFRRRTNRGNRYIADIKNALSALVQGRDESVLEAISITEVTRIMNELRASILAAIRAEMPEYLPSLLC